MNFWIIFALFGTLGIPCIALLFGFADANWKNILTCSLVVLAFWFAISGASWAVGRNNADKWNDGYCKCGTHWELKGASQYRSSHTKYYACPNCYTEIEINH